MKNMIIIAYALLFFGCDNPDQEIRQRVMKHISFIPHLATLQVVYGIDFINHEKKWFSADDFYFRKDIATAFYGVNLNESEIEIVSDGNRKTLKVRVPQPKLISKDRRTAGIYFNNKNFKPENPEMEIQADWDAILNNNGKKILEQTETMTSQFFYALAYRFNLDLDFKLIPDVENQKTLKIKD
jgi:hypothetical protein